MRPIDFIIVSPPKSGTTWIATVMNKLGVDCGHEQYLNAGNLILQRKVDHPWGETSWQIVPYLGMLLKQYPHITVVQLTRSKGSVVNSMVNTGTYSVWQQVLKPTTEFVSPKKQAEWFYDSWHMMISNSLPHIRIRMLPSTHFTLSCRYLLAKDIRLLTHRLKLSTTLDRVLQVVADTPPMNVTAEDEHTSKGDSK